MEDILKFFKDGTGFLIVLGIIGIIVGVFYFSKGFVTKGYDKGNAVASNINAAEFADYDDTVVSGSAVINCINSKANANLSVIVINGADSTTYTNVDAATKYRVTAPNDPSYIDPTNNYDATIQKSTTSKAIISITFKLK